MSKTDADIERAYPVSNFPSIKESFVGFSASMQAICQLSDRISESILYTKNTTISTI